MNGFMSRTNAWLVLLVGFMMLVALPLPAPDQAPLPKITRLKKTLIHRIAELEQKQEALVRQEKELTSELAERAKKGITDEERKKFEEQLAVLKKKQRARELERMELSQHLNAARKKAKARDAEETEEQRRQQADTTRVFEDVFSEYLGQPAGQKVGKDQVEARIAEIIEERKALSAELKNRMADFKGNKDLDAVERAELEAQLFELKRKLSNLMTEYGRLAAMRKKNRSFGSPSPIPTPRPLAGGELGAIVFAERSRVMIADEFPRTAAELKRLVESGEPAARAKALELQRQLAEQAQDLRELKRSDPEAYEQAKKVYRLDVDSELLGQAYRKSSDEKVRAQLLKQLQQVLEQAFDARMVMRERKANRIEQELKEIRELLASRAANREQIIERRRNKLLGVEDAMDW